MHLGLCLSIICLAGNAFAGVARAEDCGLASDAAIAQAKVAHAVTHVMTVPNKAPERMEMIFAGDTVYAQIDGQWHATPFPMKDQIAMAGARKNDIEKLSHTCEKLTGQPINGQPASLLVIRTQKDGKPNEALMWISDKTSLPLRMELHLPDGLFVSDDFRYDNIVIPAGAR